MLQFPAPLPPGDIPPLTAVERLMTCFFITTMGVFVFSMLLPRKHFVALFKIAFPWMPDKLE
jgi:hypothetical protein